MPRHDPTAGLDRAAHAWRRYKALMSWMTAAAVIQLINAL
jgi:hypothetical protein